jgi:hypothetical protein
VLSTIVGAYISTSMSHPLLSGMRLALPSVMNFRVAIGAAFVSLLITVLVHVQDLDPHRASFQQFPASETSVRQPLDLTSLLQGLRVHVEFNSLQDKDLPETQTKQESGMIPRESDGPTPLKGVLAQHATPEAEVSDISLVSLSGGQGVTHQAAATIGEASAGFRARLWESSFSRFVAMQHARSTGGVAIVLMVVLIGCTCVAALSLVYDNRPFARASGSGQASASAKDGSLSPAIGAPPWDSTPVRYTRLGSATSVQEQRSYIRPGFSPPNSTIFTPQLTSKEVPAPPSRMEMFSLASDAPTFDAQRDPRPPPLCPTLVMPVCEARFGIPMYELAQLASEGELGIVGLSGNPLLRAVVKKVGAHRMLEISMPEQNSAPRATVAPSTDSNLSLMQGSRALEIRGMRGSFYGILEMRSSGACYVVKDGQSVLTIDGEEHSLQLSIKSSIGAQLASVRCSAEPFGGVDHVEIRVEPGVDTVLVLSVVLAVLLLSPYLPNPMEGIK